MHMPEIEIITDGGRRWPAAEKLRIVEETMYDGESISAVARRNGFAPNLLYCWRKLMELWPKVVDGLLRRCFEVS